MSAFDDVIGFTLQHEGGVSYDTAGGVTNFGISSVYNPGVDVAHLTQEQAAAIYKQKYWDLYRCDQLAWPMSGAYFEACVNPGVAYAQDWLTRAKSVHEFLLFRAQHYRERAESRPDRLKYFHGWIDRVLDFFQRFAV